MLNTYLEWSESCGLPGDGEGQGEGGPAHIHQVTEKNTDNLGATCNDSSCSAQKKLKEKNIFSRPNSAIFCNMYVPDDVPD